MAAMRGLIPTMLETRIRLLFSGVAKPFAAVHESGCGHISDITRCPT
jgi:hypothetical protein